MSTLFRIMGRGKRLTESSIKRLIEIAGWSLSIRKDKIIVNTPTGYIHVYKTGSQSYNQFERFGMNNPLSFIYLLQRHGYEVCSEHDKIF
jgi:hypothetical protein